VRFLHFEAHVFCANILFYGYHTYFIKISWYCKFVMRSSKLYDHCLPSLGPLGGSQGLKEVQDKEVWEVQFGPRISFFIFFSFSKPKVQVCCQSKLTKVCFFIFHFSSILKSFHPKFEYSIHPRIYSHFFIFHFHLSGNFHP
jgi:hypothetical protein